MDDNGSSKGIGNPADLAHLKAQRGWAKCVATTGQTARVEQYRPLQKKHLVVFTNLNADDFPLLASQAGVEFKEYKDQSSLSDLEDRFGNVLVEFGPTLLEQALADSTIDEVLISVSGETSSFNEAVLAQVPFDLGGFDLQSVNVEPTLAIARFTRI